MLTENLEKIWCVDLTSTERELTIFDVIFKPVALAVSSSIQKDNPKAWLVSSFYVGKIQKFGAFLVSIRTFYTLKGLRLPLIVTRISTCNWAKRNLNTFQPLKIGNFFIYGGHISMLIPFSTIPLLIDATVAFGSGEHPSTQGCLLGLRTLIHQRYFTNVLDVGCGTAILALAAAKLWKTRVLAFDRNKSAIHIAQSAVRRNGMHRYIHILLGDGCKHSIIPQKTFTLIIANVLAYPLVHMATNLTQALQPGGFIVLSGLLLKQERVILARYQAQSIVLYRRIFIQPWLTLILRKRYYTL